MFFPLNFSYTVFLINRDHFTDKVTYTRIRVGTDEKPGPSHKRKFSSASFPLVKTFVRLMRMVEKTFKGHKEYLSWRV